MNTLPPPFYYAAVADYGTDIDVFICMVRVHDDAEVSIDIKRIGRSSQCRPQQVPAHHDVMTSEEELRAVGATSIPKKKVAGAVETEIEQLLKQALQVPSVTARKIRQTDLTPLF